MDPDRSTPVPEQLSFDAIGSSNDVVLRLATQGVAEHTTVHATEQTQARAGTGRWHAPPGGLWMSALWMPGLDAQLAPRLTLASLWGIREGIRQATGVAAGLKWPNDLIVEGKKLGGVLVEGRIEDATVTTAAIGLGVNANNPVHELPDEVAEQATSLQAVTDRDVDVEALAGAVSEGLREARALVEDPSELVRQFESCWTQKGATVEIDAGHRIVEGRAIGVAEDGQLILETEDGGTWTSDDPSLAKFVRILQ